MCQIGDVFFILGSCLFTSGAMMDYFRLERSHFETTGEEEEGGAATEGEGQALTPANAAAMVEVELD